MNTAFKLSAIDVLSESLLSTDSIYNHLRSDRKSSVNYELCEQIHKFCYDWIKDCFISNSFDECIKSLTRLKFNRLANDYSLMPKYATHKLKSRCFDVIELACDDLHKEFYDIAKEALAKRLANDLKTIKEYGFFNELINEDLGFTYDAICETVDYLIDHLHNEYELPYFDIGLGCCLLNRFFDFDSNVDGYNWYFNQDNPIEFIDHFEIVSLVLHFRLNSD